jgi:predicted nuclease of predicted toxin-antitoxin system
MRVLLDENVDRLLKSLFAADFDVLTVRERGWKGMKNGELLRAAEKEFDAFVTMDKNLKHQQSLSALNLAVVILRAKSNAYPIVAPLIPKVNEVLRTVQAGQVVHVESL